MKILIIEDEPILGKLYKKALEKNGFLASWASSGQEANKIIKALIPDLFIIDHGLQDTQNSGMDLLIVFKKAFPKAKFIMLSNYNDADLRAKAIELGANDFLLKLNTSPAILAQYIKKLFA